MSASRSGLKFRNLVLCLLFMAGVLNYLDRQIIAVLKPLLQEQLGWDDSDYGHLTAIFQLASALAFLVAGWMVDRMGWRRAGGISVGSWSVAAMAHGLVQGMLQFSLVRIALGATEALGTPSMIKTTAALFSAKQRSLAIGVINVSNNLGAVLTPLIIPGIALEFGWRAAFMLAGGLGLVWVPLWIAVTRRVGPDQEMPEPADTGGGEFRWRSVLLDRRTWAIGGTKALIDQVWWFMLFWIPDLLNRQFHIGLTDFALPLAGIYLLAATGSIAAGYGSGRLVQAGVPVVAARKIMMLVCAVLVAILPLVLYVEDYRIAVVILGLALACHQGFSVNVFALITDIIPRSQTATVVSIGALCGNLAGMLVLQAAGWWINGPYGYAPFLFVAAISYLLALAWFQVMAGDRQED